MNGRFGVLIPLRVEKRVDRVLLAERFGGAAALKVLPDRGGRRSSWRRVEWLFASPPAQIDKLPSRTLRAAKLRLFRAFKLLGALKERLGVVVVVEAPATEIRSAL